MDGEAVLERLRQDLPEPVVAGPDDGAYRRALQALAMADAGHRAPVAIVAPRHVDDVVAAVRVAAEAGVAVTVRGGSHSSLCVADGAIVLDLSVHLDRAELVDGGASVRAAGGATMGTVLAAATEVGRVVPIGAALTPGLGLALQGGFGSLARSTGLTLDQLEAVELVGPTGEILTLDGTSRGTAADLWWAVRGAAPNFGVVVSATLRTTVLATVEVARYVLDLDALVPLVGVAQGLPRSTSCSFVLATDPAGRARLLVYAVARGDAADGAEALAALDEAAAASGSPVHHRQRSTSRYLDVPPFAVPGPDGALPAPAPPGGPLADREHTFVRTLLLPRLDDPAPMAEALVRAVADAPTPNCRIDLQHGGGAIGDVDPAATAFVHRQVEWNLPIAGAWTGPDAGRAEAQAWARDTEAAVAPWSLGTYVVDVRPDQPGAAEDVRRAFGPNLGRLAALKALHDPAGTFGRYYPLPLDDGA